MALELYYSSGDENSNAYSGQPKKSIGGFLTDVKVPSDTLRALFGVVSLKSLSEGKSEYRMVFVKNANAENLTLWKVWVELPTETATLNPDDLAPAPSDGDEYIVPEGGQGAWSGQDGKKATYVDATSGWTFSFANFCKYEFGFVSVADTTEGKFVRRIENVFQAPSGIVFTSADGVDNKLLIGDGTFKSGEYLGIWVKRVVQKRTFTGDDLTCDEGAIKVDESITIKFEYENGV